MKPGSKLESVGWIFYGALSLLLMGPVTYGVYISLYNTLTIAQRIGTGVATTLILAAIVTASVNEVLYRSARRRMAAEKHQERKVKQRKKRGKKK